MIDPSTTRFFITHYANVCIVGIFNWTGFLNAGANYRRESVQEFYTLFNLVVAGPSTYLIQGLKTSVETDYF